MLVPRVFLGYWFNSQRNIFEHEHVDLERHFRCQLSKVFLCMGPYARILGNLMPPQHAPTQTIGPSNMPTRSIRDAVCSLSMMCFVYTAIRFRSSVLVV